jgi:GT2 family glycosyltransferase
VSELLFSVVIPTFNRPADLARCLAALACSTFDPNRFEVIVVNDGGGNPESALRDLGRPLNLRLLAQPNRGPGAARNYGARSARGQFIAFTDDDCIPATDWLETFDRSLKKNPESLHGGRTVNGISGNPFSDTSQSLVDYVHRYYNDASTKRTRFFASNNIAVSARKFEHSGGFDESLCAAEDRDFCRTWHNLGWSFEYVPDAVIKHAHRLTLRGLEKQHFTYGRGALPYWRKASEASGSRIKVEPIAFYAGMLTHPFSQRVPNAALISVLIVVSQFANAAGFAYEAFRTRRTRRVTRVESAKLRVNGPVT